MVMPETMKSMMTTGEDPITETGPTSCVEGHE